MKNWRAHRLWVGLLAIAILIGATHYSLLSLAQRKATQKLADLHIENTQTAASLHQLQDDIAEAEKMKNQLGAHDAEKILAPVDRLRAAKILEKRASEARLSHFTYTMSPEHKAEIDTVGSGKQVLATSKLLLTADVPTDSDAYIFLDTICHTLPGRVALKQITLERIGAADAEVSDANLHLTAEAEWLSNGAPSNLAEATE